MSSLPMITLLPTGMRGCGAGHPWVYSNEVAMDAAAKALPAGTLVRVSASNGHSSALLVQSAYAGGRRASSAGTISTASTQSS